MVQTVYEFNACDTDVILLSNDAKPTEFRVHRCILAAASPFYRDMFTLPQTPLPDKQLPVIPVSESTPTLDALLRFVYPVRDPHVGSLDELVPILGAAVKYDFASVIHTLRQLLLSPRFLQTAPTRVFAVACRFDLDDEARIASQHTLKVNILDCPLSEDLKYITAYSYHRLLDLHRRRARAAQEMLKLPQELKCTQCNGSGYSVFGAPKWWYEFEKRAKEELALRPTTDVIFSMSFLAQTASAAGCQRCPGSVFDAMKYLQDLKRKIDELPATI
jgi:hypothetical protein